MELKREECITGLLEIIFKYGYLMEGYASIEPFYFTMDVPSSTIRPTTVNTWVVTFLQLILTPSFITVDIFGLVVKYLFFVLFVPVKPLLITWT